MRVFHLTETLQVGIKAMPENGLVAGLPLGACLRKELLSRDTRGLRITRADVFQDCWGRTLHMEHLHREAALVWITTASGPDGRVRLHVSNALVSWGRTLLQEGYQELDRWVILHEGESFRVTRTGCLYDAPPTLDVAYRNGRLQMETSSPELHA